jgi:hypothetical protein
MPPTPQRLLPLVAVTLFVALALSLTACAGAPPAAASSSPAPSASVPAAVSPSPTAGSEQTLEKGLVDERLTVPAWLLGTSVHSVVDELDALRVGWVRLNVLWSDLEPSQGVYNQRLLAAVDQRVDSLDAQGVKVMITVYEVPRWASDTRWWNSPPLGERPGYRGSYAIKGSALPRLSALGAMLARRYAGRVSALECWNEPNFWWFLYPQRTRSDPDFGPHTYLRMLTAFSNGVREAGTGVAVIGGATMSFGRDDGYRTNPLHFARYLRAHGAAALIDGYSHHPYIPGSSRNRAPDSRPDHPRYTVTLGNVGALLRIFPHKPFYLTEFGYNTRPSRDFGPGCVSERTQSRYLKQAYAVASRHPQIKVLFWYLTQDVRRSAAPADGVYTGLQRVDGSKKPSWYSFQALP